MAQERIDLTGASAMAQGEGLDSPRTIEGDRPSRHGAILGEALALIADLGERDARMDNWRDRCATCAFRKGTAPNMTAGTGMVALNCVLGIDKDRFACHHGMKDGQPAKICVGYIAARIAPFSSVKEVMALLASEIAGPDGEPDEIRAAFDVWLTELDPEGKMDVYQTARAFQRRSA
jgi:hypothetical protein